MCKVYIRNIIEFTHSFRFFRGHLLHCTRNTESASGAAIQGASLELQGQGKIPSPAVFPQRQPYSLPSPEQKVKVDNRSSLWRGCNGQAEKNWTFYYDNPNCFWWNCKRTHFPAACFIKIICSTKKPILFIIKIWVYYVVDAITYEYGMTGKEIPQLGRQMTSTFSPEDSGAGIHGLQLSDDLGEIVEH